MNDKFKNMNRRELLAALAGTGVYISLHPKISFAAAPGSDILFIHVLASGGWDQALFCDPKDALRGPYLTDQTLYPNSAQVRMAGNIPYLSFADFGRAQADGFFTKYHDRLLVINGIDCRTNNHSIGERYFSSGSINSGFPCFGAQIGAVHGSGRALPFISGEGIRSETGGVVPATVMKSENISDFSQIFNSNNIYGTSRKYVDPSILALVESARNARLERQKTANKLPSVSTSLDQLAESWTQKNELSSIVIPPNRTVPAGTYLYQHSMRLIELVFNCFRQGQTASMNIGFGSFDTHTDNELGQRNALRIFLDHLGYIMDQAEDVANGGANKVKTVVICSSDFGRTPFRTTTGTDHWPIGSMLVLQSSTVKGSINLPYNTVIGGTDADLKALKVDPQTLQLSSSGIVLSPGHVYNGLRRLAGITNQSKLANFPINLDQELAIG